MRISVQGTSESGLCYSYNVLHNECLCAGLERLHDRATLVLHGLCCLHVSARWQKRDPSSPSESYLPPRHQLLWHNTEQPCTMEIIQLLRSSITVEVTTTA
jgi:hypothetical protein